MLDQNPFQSVRPRLRDYPLHKNLTGWLIYALVYALRFMPMRLSWLLGNLLGSLAALLYKTKTIAVNLELCFPHLDRARRQQLRRKYFRHLGQAFFDLGLAWIGSAEKVKRHVKIIGAEYINEALAKNQGVILLAPHMVGLELGYKRISIEWPAICMYRKPRCQLQHQLSRYFRTGLGGKCLERYESLRPLIGMIKQGTVFYYLPDQDPDQPGKDYVFAPFFGHPAATFTAMTRLAKMSKAVVIPLFTQQLPFGRGYEIHLQSPLQNFPGENELVDATVVNKAIEDGLKGIEAQYFWSYRRFKTQPDNQPSPYRH